MNLEALFPNGLSDDALLGARVQLTQPVGGYRAAIDPVLLAAAVPAASGDYVADLGSGAGAVALCLSRRVPDCYLAALEREPDLAALASYNVGANGLSGNVAVSVGDVMRPPFAAETFDHVAMNPPYLSAGRFSEPPARLRRVAAVEGEARLCHWLRTGYALVRRGGTLTLVHRADRLGEILTLLGGLQDGGLKVLPLWPQPGKPARRVLVSCRKGDAMPLTMLPGLVLHAAGGRFSAEAEKVLRGGQGLDAAFSCL